MSSSSSSLPPLFTIGGYGTGNGQFFSPYFLTSDKEGRIVVSDHYNKRIQFFSNDLLFEKSLPLSFKPLGIAINEENEGNLIVSDPLDAKIHIINSNNGEIIRSIGEEQGQGQLKGPNGIAFDPI